MPRSKASNRLSLNLSSPMYAAKEQAALASSPSMGTLQSAKITSTSAKNNEEEGLGEGAHLSTTPPHQRSPAMPAEPQSPAITSLPPVPVSPKHSREASRSLFSNIRAAKSSAKIPGSDPSQRPPGSGGTGEHAPQSALAGQPMKPGQASSREGSLNESAASTLQIDTSEGSRAATATPSSGYRDDELSAPPGRPAPIPVYNSRSLPKTVPSTPQTPSAKKAGSVFGFMKRGPQHQHEENGSLHSAQEERAHSRDVSAGMHDGLRVNPLAANDPKHVLVSSKSGFLKALKTGTNKAVSGYKKGREKLMKNSNKPATSPAPQARQVVDPDYEMQILLRPLLDQVRLTRIAPRLEQSRDKTEFWLPSLPWRCIDYLNFKGVEEEGIYRHSGSQIQINFYKQKFDRERDVDLYEETELYDVNTVSSLLKAWFRDLPDELFPGALQEVLVSTQAESHGAPDQLKEMISNLEPWRYYLLFAITCHLSLIASSSDKNKMTIENLHTCIGRSLRIERVVFFWLVGDWRNCWIGCAKEKEYLDAEYAWLEDETAQLEGDSSNPPSRHQESAPLHFPLGFAPDRIPSPASAAKYRPGNSDSRGGSSSSRTDLQPEISYLPSTVQMGISSQGPRSTGSRKASQTESNDGAVNPRSFSDRMQQQQQTSSRIPSALAGRERSPVGRRPARQDAPGSRGDDRATEQQRRAQSLPRSEGSQQRGKSPSSSSGRRRPRGETAVGYASPANRSPSQGSDQYFDASNGSNIKTAGGRRRREGADAPEMPVMTRERLETLQRDGRRSRKGSEAGQSRSRDRKDRDVDLPPQLEALKLDVARNGSSFDIAFDERAQPMGEGKTQHERNDGKYRLSEQKFPEPISPTFRSQ